MASTSFAERIQRIETTQDIPVAKRMLVGVSEEIEKQATAQTALKSTGAGKVAAMPFRFGAGLALMFALYQLVKRMAEIHVLLETSALAPFTTPIMASLAATVVFVIVFLAFKMQRAVFRMFSEPARLPFALGMMIGLALAAGPGDLVGAMLAQVQ